ncbi:MAG TPA: PVC-type heme-binding CxxCH protein [Tepidisphaeraceae bacterium]|nr:PVC-type heme-binding CxxCH protein [Tepidisphaeraceae bacterium]
MRRPLATAAAAALLSLSAAAVSPPIEITTGFRPLRADGTAYNLDFETGDLRDWTATGDAFAGQPVKGDAVAVRRKDMKSDHQGQYWIGGYEVATDKPKGTLTSAPFAVTHPYASFLFAAGKTDATRAEIELIDGGQSTVIFKTSGTEVENLRRVVVDLRKHQGKQIRVRLVDDFAGGWGHLNFDDFRFHPEDPKFPKERLLAAAGAGGAAKPPAGPVDLVKNAGLSPADAVKAMEVPAGFKVSLFAAEPQVAQPVAMTIDARGRLWVAEAHNYPRKGKPGEGKDRILILEDTDNDGKADKVTTFADKLNLVSGLEVGFGGVWVGQAPELLFIPDKDGDDKPDGPPQVLLDGWGHQDTHETLNSFTWGPDGWLYGCHGVFTHSKVGKPGTPDEQREKINAGVWRYHPVRHTFEVFAHGTSNPWGVEFNDRGQAFVTACVIPHLYHMVQGGRYHRQAGQHFNPYTFADIKTCADHVHWAGGGSPHSGNNRSDAAGGGHAHCGILIYNGGAWPDAYRDQIFMSNLHGNRINQDVLKPKGSGYTAAHGPDFLKTNDKWSRLIAFKTGPDGSVYTIDWYDKQACHLNKPEVWDRTNGRVYKIAYTGASSTPPFSRDPKGELQATPKASAPAPKPDFDNSADINVAPPDAGGGGRKGGGGGGNANGGLFGTPTHIGTATTHQLVSLQSHSNDALARHARRVLQERQPKDAIPLLKSHLATGDVTTQLRILWSLHVLSATDEATLLQELKHPDAYVRGWTIQLACETATPSPALLAEFARLAKEDNSPVVRLYLASACQRLPAEHRWDILKGLLSHAEDAADQNLPLMYWYALEPLVATDKAKGLTLAAGGKIPQVREFATRRIAAK